jgi:hypothetical protein
LLQNRPFRALHHTISHAGLVGGSTWPHPGEISLAHGGVLFLDELPHFGPQMLEVMRLHGVEVFYVKDLLSETIQASREAKRLLIEQVATEYTFGWSLVDEIREFLWNLDLDSLARHLIGGLTVVKTG